MKLNIRVQNYAFTLIELLAVITIIAILSGTAMVAINQAMLAAKIARATADARQIGLALRGYSQDHDGTYPSDASLSTANDAFRELFPNYMQIESNFAVGNSPVGKKADNQIDPPERILQRGENHWAYIAGLSDTSHPLWPLIVDHTDGSGTYTTHENEPGGTWRGTKTIVIRCDGGAEAKPLKGPSTRRYLPRFDDEQKNALALATYMGEGPRLLEPAR